MQGAAQNAATPADMSNAQQIGVAGAFPPFDAQMSPPPNEGPVGPGPQYMPTTPQTPQQPGLSQVAQNVRNMPPTSPSIYQGISADDRANLMKQLLAQKASPGNLAASGVAGLGDAISNAFGRGGQHAQQDVRNAQNQNISNQIGVMDTQRQQKMQDLQVQIAQQKQDPNSPVSNGYRHMYQMIYGKVPPSGLSAAMMEGFAPEITKAFEANTQKAIAGGAQSVEAGKALYGETFADWIKEKMGFGGVSQGEEALAKATGVSAPASTNGWGPVKRK
jgi:hypothetical protein